MLELGVKFLISYFIGSMMGAMIVGKIRGGVDIRTMGSGNAGGTNALRTQGVVFALGVVIVDVGKGVIGAGLVPGLDIPFVPRDPEISRTWLTLVCAAAAVLGHVWPIYHGFKGGKGCSDAGRNAGHSGTQADHRRIAGMGVGPRHDWLRRAGDDDRRIGAPCLAGPQAPAR